MAQSSAARSAPVWPPETILCGNLFMSFSRAGASSFDMLGVATLASRAEPLLLQGGVGRASQDIQHERLRPRRRCLLAALPRLQRARAQSVYQSGRRRLRNPLPAAYGFQLFGKSHGFSLRETRIVIKPETDDVPVRRDSAFQPPVPGHRENREKSPGKARYQKRLRIG